MIKKTIRNVKRKLRTASTFFKVVKDYYEFKSGLEENGSLKWKDRKFCLDDAVDTHPIDYHYTYHPAWAARKLKEINPKKHVDISSIFSFSTQISAFIPIDYYDYRPASLKLSNMRFKQADLKSLPFKTGELESVSCMHTIEHVGLGRYGDEIDPLGDIKAIKELQRVTKKGGSILFVVPIGREKIMFNAHRIYSYDKVLKLFDQCKLREFKAVLDDPKDGLVSPSSQVLNRQNYACGCFWFIKS